MRGLEGLIAGKMSKHERPFATGEAGYDNSTRRLQRVAHREPWRLARFMLQAMRDNTVDVSQTNVAYVDQ